MSAFHILLALVLAERIAELDLAAGNNRRLKAAGGEEIGAGSHPLVLMLGASWLVALLLTTDPAMPVHWTGLCLFGLLMVGRLWTLGSLGRAFTTRIITLPGVPLVRRGPYRLLNHPFDLLNIAEIALLPLLFGNPLVAVVWSVLGAALLSHRIRLENAALDSRRGFATAAQETPVMASQG